MEKLLITGGSGFIGRNLLGLLNDKYDVYLISFREGLSISNFSGQVICCDLLNVIETDKTISALKPDKLIHLAWGMEPGNYNLPDNFSWLTASMSLLEIFQENGGKSVMIAGSCVQYDWALGGCDEERTPRANNSIYGNCKNILEDFALSFCAANDIQCVWVRPFFMYGAHEDERRLVAYLIKNLLENKEAVVQNGVVYRDFLLAEDVASLMLALFETDQSGVFNIGSGGMHNLGDVALTLGRLLDSRDLLKIKMPENVSNKYVVANMDKVKSVLDWQPKYNLESGLSKTIEWWKQNI